MPDRVRNILDRIAEWWKKFNTKQRALMISLAAVVLVALGILAFAVSRPKYVPLVTCSTTKEAAEVKSLLDGDSSLDYKVSDNGLVFTINQKNEATAVLLLGSNDIASTSYNINNVTSGSFSTTESDKQKLYQDYLEKKFADHLSQLDPIESAVIDITLPNNDGTILSKEEQGSASVTLFLKKPIDTEKAYGIARYVATELGNDDTTSITILDGKGNILYCGADADTSIGIVSSQLSFQEKQESLIKSEIVNTLTESKLYSNVEIAMNLKVDYDTTERVTHEYYAPAGQTNGMPSSTSEYKSESYGGSAATPGTDANDDTTYVTEDDARTYSKIEQSDIQYQNNEEITTKRNAGGVVDYDNSSVGIVCTKYIVYDEATLEAAGELDDMTFDEFKAAHSEPVQVEVPEDVLTLIANATGFSANSISVICYERPEFQEKQARKRDISSILQIVLAVLIFLMLGYVVFRSTRKQKEADLEPELSVDGLLESTAKDPEESLEDIGYSEKSETRILIEKFVEDNPEAAALLLRNWLNDDWG